MPCRGGGPSSEAIENSKLRKRIKKLERLEPLLCAACRVLEELGFDFAKNPELDEWWDHHKEEDLKRLEKEAKREFRRRLALEASQKPFKDLTQEERKAMKQEGYF